MPIGCVIQGLPTDGSDQPLDEGWRQGYVRQRLDLGGVEDSEVRLPAVKFKQGIIVRAEMSWAVGACEDAVEHAAYDDTVEDTRMDRESDDPTAVLIHDHHDPVRSEDQRFAEEQIHTPEAVLGMVEEGQPRGSASAWIRPLVLGQHTTNRVFVDLDPEDEGDLLSDSTATEARACLLHFDDALQTPEEYL